ncbi:epoxide hydrolase [Pseudomonadales bacterium]|nr:epoxide hydrolase [Pseudomonadales bacterium]MDB4150886.1 epoxide hydrolase [Pseudomonadales bacterium]MDB9867065.1 epoxide hydrolase [Pseudomonadales bacterium]MDB9879760.1 epoxide hydrolase [Pseudomonadales bacterium]
MSDIRPFTIDIPAQQIADLKTRLALTRWPDKETPDDWSQGIPLAYMQEIQDYWLHHYDWPARQAKLNMSPGFLTELDGLDIHFLHIRSPHANARPLLLTHGWPGSIVEFQKVIAPLTDPTQHGGSADEAFHLVCPTLPGFGFSGKPTTPGWDIAKIATAWNTLMVRLGYDHYLAQGGDWGAIVTSMIGAQNLGNCQGIHITMPIVPPDPETMNDLSELEKSTLAGLKFYQDHDSGYSKQQATRPQTLGYGLADSPIGQAAWIIEKFYQWTDCDGHPENVISRDELLDNVMLYWLPDAGASSARIYWESFGRTGNDPINLPVGCSIFPKEIFKTSERWAKKRFTNLVHFNVLQKGGHFAALEQPEAFIGELRDCFGKMT